jgi:predicted AlkP superfamily pyrophosphatase or phosphodiesterase
MVKNSYLAFGIFAFAVHVILCYSVIDIHFQSPIVHGIQRVEPQTIAPAKRLIFIVADGETLGSLRLLARTLG